MRSAYFIVRIDKRATENPQGPHRHEFGIYAWDQLECEDVQSIQDTVLLKATGRDFAEAHERVLMEILDQLIRLPMKSESFACKVEALLEKAKQARKGAFD